MAKLESAIQTEILNWLKKKKKSVVYKHRPYPAGIPDIVFYHKGKCVFFEVKRDDTCHTSKIQNYRISKLRDAGIPVYVVRSLDEVKIIYKREFNG